MSTPDTRALVSTLSSTFWALLRIWSTGVVRGARIRSWRVCKGLNAVCITSLTQSFEGFRLVEVQLYRLSTLSEGQRSHWHPHTAPWEETQLSIWKRIHSWENWDLRHWQRWWRSSPIVVILPPSLVRPDLLKKHNTVFHLQMYFKFVFPPSTGFQSFN